MADSLITIVVTPRDRFCYTQESLESLYRHADAPFELIYLDAGSSDQIRDYLRQQARERKFQLIRVDHFLAPCQARNVARKHIKTPYAVFVENDVIFADGWLSPLLKCAEETGCALVCPLTCQDQPVHEDIHFAGGNLEIRERVENGKTERYFYEDFTYKQGSKHFEIKPPLQRVETTYTETHCFLVRLDMLNKINGFDEGVISIRDQIDFSLSMRRGGGKIYLEPRSIVTFIGHFDAPKLDPWDESFYKLRWSDAWGHNSLTHLSKKWNITEDDYFRKLYSRLRWRRRLVVIRPKIKHIKPRLVRRLLEEIMVVFDRFENKRITDDFARQHKQQAQASA
jgi:GT2 family glycosyltransferase